MKVFRVIQDMVDWRYKVTGSIGFVPTMGAFHEGHLSLIRIAKIKANFVVVSIFVNPLQFGKNEDFRSYPRNIEQDIELLRKEKVEVVFLPENGEMYPCNYSTYIEVPELSTMLCGKSRHGHFRGVCTVVCKLFNIIKPSIAVFGEKDAQQSVIVKKMLSDLNFDTKIILGKTIREKDGLAMSSRNAYLTEKDRGEAVIIYHSLKTVKKMIKEGCKSSNRIKSIIKEIISSKTSSKIDYVEIVRKSDLKPVNILSGKILIAIAVKFSKVRLIDNITVNVI